MNKPKNFSEVLDVIEKMKCCGNCRHYEVGYEGTPCGLDNVSVLLYEVCGDWECKFDLESKYNLVEVPEKIRTPDASYRDRVHGASIAILPSLMERRHESGYSDDGACHESVRLAKILIDSIDKAIAKREVP